MHKHTEAADVFTDEEIVQRAVTAKERAEEVESESSPSRWEEADCYKALSDRGWAQQKIAEECGVNQATVSRFISCSKNYAVPHNRTSFWHAYSEVTGEKSAHVSHNSGENEWYTPPEYIESARSVLGTIELDPASSDAAQKNVKAKRYFTIDDDGLSQDWKGRVFLNPPYSKDLIGKFSLKLVASHESGSVPAAVLLVNNATDTQWFQQCSRSASAICFPGGRIKYLDVTGEPKNTPLQGQAFLYFGKNCKLFSKVFTEFGFVVRRQRGVLCPICEHESWCTVSDQGDVVRCMRVESDKESVGCDGPIGWIHRL